MKKSFPLFLSACLSFAALGPIHANEPAAAPFTLTETETAAGWRLLFDGRSLAGWRSLKTETPPAGWEVIDGNLVRNAKGGDLVTVDDFGDFELVLDWKLSSGANSGIMYRVGLTEGNTFRTGPEYQLLDDELHPDAKRGIDGNRTVGSLYDLIPAAKTKIVHPIGEWNTTRIVVRGWR
ncbi:MAG: DUF1080 domain-containing protein, partial [Opitutaceae bacterium]|nr:DUF1080 domain-containing protein [Opitutaceae bacterium]